MRSLYEAEAGHPELHLPYGRAALGFMGWQLRRGLLNAPDARVPGSPWWRAVNERLLHEPRRHEATCSGWAARCRPGAPAAAPRSPGNRRRGRGTGRTTRASWRPTSSTASWPSPVARRALLPQPDSGACPLRARPRRDTSPGPELDVAARPGPGRPTPHGHRHLVSLSRVMPREYPLTMDLDWYIGNEHGIGRILDRGVIQPRVGALYSWSAGELSIPELATLVRDGLPATPGTRATRSRGTRATGRIARSREVSRFRRRDEPRSVP